MASSFNLPNNTDRKMFLNVFIECGGATSWNELLTVPIYPRRIRLSDVAKSFSYFGDDRRIVAHTKTKGGVRSCVYECRTCSWRVKFIKQPNAAGREDPWFLDSWGTAPLPANDVSPSQHGDGCHPVEVLQQGGGDILRNSMQLREYLSEHRQAKRGAIVAFMLTKGIDVSGMKKGPFYNARDNILSLLLLDEMDISSIASGDRSATSSEAVRQLFLVSGDQQDEEAAHDDQYDRQHNEKVVNQCAHSVSHSCGGLASGNAIAQPEDVLLTARQSDDGHNTLESELCAFHQSSVLPTVDEESALAESNDEGTTLSVGSSLHFSRSSRSTSTPSSETWRRIDLPSNSGSTEASSLTPSEEYLRQGGRKQVLVTTPSTEAKADTSSLLNEKSIGSFSASNQGTGASASSDLKEEEKPFHSGNTIDSTEPPPSTVRINTEKSKLEISESDSIISDPPLTTAFERLSFLNNGI